MFQIGSLHLVVVGAITLALCACEERPRAASEAGAGARHANAQGGATERHYLHHDHQGTVVATTDRAGAVRCRESFQHFGGLASASGECATQKYTGKVIDEGTGLYYYGARYYDPAAARFISADPVRGRRQDLQSHNRYAYVSNNPYRYVDPTGHEPAEVNPKRRVLGKYRRHLLSGRRSKNIIDLRDKYDRVVDKLERNAFSRSIFAPERVEISTSFRHLNLEHLRHELKHSGKIDSQISAGVLRLDDNRNVTIRQIRAKGRRRSRFVVQGNEMFDGGRDERSMARVLKTLRKSYKDRLAVHD